jgi:ERCC4-type nuclease
MLIDNRERALLQLFDPPPPTQALSVGDIWIGLDENNALRAGSVIAERKTVADLEASILDGRYREQRTRLTAMCKETGARPLYILEGEVENGRRLGATALKKHVTRLTIRYGVAVLQTRDLEDTKVLVEMLEEQIRAERDVFVLTDPAEVAYTTTICSRKSQNREDPAVFSSAVLQQCPGISAKIADALVTEFKSFAGIWSATEAEIAAVKAGARKVGTVVAQRLMKLLHGDPP